jgi:hypothetical protein
MDTKRRYLWWILGGTIALLCLGLILAAYGFGWANTGFPGKTVWDWCEDRERCRSVGIPDSVCFQTKPQLAQHMLEGTLAGADSGFLGGGR